MHLVDEHMHVTQATVYLSAAQQAGWQLHSAGAALGPAGWAAQGGAVPAACPQSHAFWDHEGAWLEPALVLALGLAQACLAQPVPKGGITWWVAQGEILSLPSSHVPEIYTS